MTHTSAPVLCSHGASSVAEGEPSPLRLPSAVLKVGNIAEGNETAVRSSANTPLNQAGTTSAAEIWEVALELQ